MKVKRYFAANMRSALEQVRQEQGPDVVILSNRKVDGGIEILTAIGEPDAELIERFTPRGTRERAPQPLTDTPPMAAAAVPPAAPAAMDPLWTSQETVIQMQREIGAIKSLLEQQLSGFAWHEFSNRSPLQARLLRVLTQLGIAPALGRNLVSTVDERREFAAAWRQVLATMQARLPCLDDPILRFGGHIALCGATGVGKTTLASKLAARYALARGSDKVALISTDDQRLGAHQQLRTFGRLVGITVLSVRGVDELPDTLAELRDRELVLIDLPGFAPSDPAFRRTLATLSGLPSRVQTYLTLSASTDFHALERVVRAVDGLPLAGCCLTKLDEAASLGPALSAVITARLPVAYVTAGQQVPDDLDAATSALLFEQMLSMGKTRPVPAESAFIEQAFAL